jgi:hypothetical protein
VLRTIANGQGSMASCRSVGEIDPLRCTSMGAEKMSAENEALVRRYVEEVYDQRKLEVADELFAPDFTLHDPEIRASLATLHISSIAATWKSRVSCSV